MKICNVINFLQKAEETLVTYVGVIMKNKTKISDY